MMLVFILLFFGVVALVIFGVIIVIRKAFKKNEDPTVAILRARYARGEIDEEELNRKMTYVKNKRI